jgi:hypothetical protein
LVTAESITTGDCPVTQPILDEPPDDPNADPFGFGYWYVNEDRTMWAPGHGVWRAGGEKVTWIRPQGTDLSVTGRRLDGEAPLQIDIPCCYPTGFQVTGLTFPSEGCWEVTARAGNSQLLFVTRVFPAGYPVSPAPAPLTKEAMAACPVSLPNVTTSPNDHFVTTIAGYQNADGTIFTELWPGGKVIFSPDGPGHIAADGSLGMKWPWYRTVPGEVIITGQRLDAPAPLMPPTVLRGVPDGYGETGFHPSGLLFPSEGCWEVTAKVGQASLTFVTLVVKAPSGK